MGGLRNCPRFHLPNSSRVVVERPLLPVSPSETLASRPVGSHSTGDFCACPQHEISSTSSRHAVGRRRAAKTSGSGNESAVAPVWRRLGPGATQTELTRRGTGPEGKQQLLGTRELPVREIRSIESRNVPIRKSAWTHALLMSLNFV